MRYNLAAWLMVVATGSTPLAQDRPPRIEPKAASASTLLTMAVFPDKHLTIVAPDSLRTASTNPPDQQFDKQLVCATGLVRRGSSGEEITVDTPSNVWVEETVTPPFAPHAHWPCEDGITTKPALIREVKPPYTLEAMKKRIEGQVGMQAVVEADGTVGDVRIVRSLDSDLDAQAVTAMKGWQFRPARFHNEPASLVVEVNMTFTMRK